MSVSHTSVRIEAASAYVKGSTFVCNVQFWHGGTSRVFFSQAAGCTLSGDPLRCQKLVCCDPS